MFHQVTIGCLRAIPIHTGTGIQTTTVGILLIIIRIATTIIQATTIIHPGTTIRAPIGVIIGIRTHTMAITGGIGDLARGKS